VDRPERPREVGEAVLKDALEQVKMSAGYLVARKLDPTA
jgi:hypothetical protein